MEQIGAVDKAVAILFHLHGVPRPQGVTGIGRALGIPKSSTHRLLAALGRGGLVDRDERGRYRPGSRLIALGLGALERDPVVVMARPVLELEAEAVGETFFLVGLRAGELVVLDKVEGTGLLRAAPRVGSRLPVHATAVGRLFLAFAPEDLPFPRGRLEAFTPHTVTDVEELRAGVDDARVSGRAGSRDQWIPGLSVLAAPVLAGSRMRMLAALALAAPTARLDELGGDELASRVVRAAEHISARLL
jgi:DNA-binding IclR family transcriptional regulator